MATMGTCEVLVKVDSSRVLDVVAAMDLMKGLLDGHGHGWTDDESAVLEKAVAACGPANLVTEAPSPEQVERPDLVAALEFYADPASHEARTEDDSPVWPIYFDKGKRAREALGLPEPPTFAERLAAITTDEEATV